MSGEERGLKDTVSITVGEMSMGVEVLGFMAKVGRGEGALDMGVSCM